MSVRCILCGEGDTVSLMLSDGDTFKCSSCDGEFTCEDVQEQMTNWAKMLKWARQCPAREDQVIAR